MSFRLVRWIAQVLICTGMLFSASNYALAQGSLTGHYEAQPIRSCSLSQLEDSKGVAYNHHCFTGNAYGYSEVLEVVQNGKMICGRYFQCGGFNCNKVYDGEIAGVVENGKLNLFWTNGHQSNVPAETLAFRIVKGGLVGELAKSNEPSLIKRSSTLKNSQIYANCVPKFSEQVLVSSEYALNVSGILKADQVVFTNLAQKQFASNPSTKRIALTNSKTATQWTDVRAAGNYVIRKLVITNHSNKPLSVDVEHPESCSEFLKSSYNKRKDLGYFSSENGNEDEIQPMQTVSVASCSGSVWRIAKTLPACPKFQCLESCKC